MLSLKYVAGSSLPRARSLVEHFGIVISPARVVNILHEVAARLRPKREAIFQTVWQPRRSDEFGLCWIREGRHYPKLSPVVPCHQQQLEAFRQLVEFHLKDREKQREYGFLNYGDRYWNDPDVQAVMWGNLEYDLPRGFFLQYLRSGDRRFFDRAEQAARHRIDVDVLHAVNKKLFEFGASDTEMGPGTIWAHSVGHTGGYYGRYADGQYHDLPPLKIVSPPHCLGICNLGHHWWAEISITTA